MEIYRKVVYNMLILKGNANIRLFGQLLYVRPGFIGEGYMRWLHLSDVHYKVNERYSTQKMRDMLTEKLKELVTDNKIDLIFITGDLVFKSGKYDSNLITFLDKVLEITGLGVDDLIIIPGNHDLKRSQTRTLMLKGLRGDCNNIEIDTVNELKKAFKSYNNFLKSYKKSTFDKIYELIRRDGINIFTMNTAITAGTDKDESYLKIVQEEFYSTIKGLKEDEESINVAVGHHPIFCFDTESQSIIKHNFLDFNIDLYLCGHIHKAGYEYDIDDGRRIETYKCGAGMVDDYTQGSFLIGNIDITDKTGELIYFAWNKDTEYWDIESGIGRRVKAGKQEIVLDRFKNAVGSENTPINDVNEDEFRKFIMHFHETINLSNVNDANINPKDIYEKLSNMKCNSTVEKQFRNLSKYFPVINGIMESSLLNQIQKESIPNIIICEYNQKMDMYINGSQILEAIVEAMLDEYKGYFFYSISTLRTYFKILVYWSIYECDIFNDKK